jgi:hypothetical protein
MISRVILDFDGTPEEISGDDIYYYSGTKKFHSLTSLEALANTREISLTVLGEFFPNLEKLRLNNSVIPNVRDIGCAFLKLRFLWLPRCGLTSLNGISTVSGNLEELYLAFNQISDVSDLMGMDRLKVLDLEENKIQDLSNIQFLTCCSGLKSLTLAGNPCTFGIRDYVRETARLLPSLLYLDESRIKGRGIASSEPFESLERTLIVAEQKIRPPEGIPALRFPRGRAVEKDEVIMTEFIDDQIQCRPPTSRGYQNWALVSSPRRHQNDSIMRSLKSAAIIRPLGTVRRISVK